MATITPAACTQITAEYPVVTAVQFRQMIHDDPTAYILDVRTPEEFAQGHIAGAHNLDWLNQQQFTTQARNLPHDRTLYVYCKGGLRSAEACDYLTAHGYPVIDLEGGYQAWKLSK